MNISLLENWTVLRSVDQTGFWSRGKKNYVARSIIWVQDRKLCGLGAYWAWWPGGGGGGGAQI